MAKKKTYRVVVPVTRASGHREYVVEASSPEAAKAAVDANEVGCEEEILEVEDVAPIEEWEVEEEKE